jgi:hypothetical protein
MRKLLVAFLTLAATDFARGQTPGTPAWDVVSVKLNQSCGGRGRGISAPPSPGRLNLECNTVENLILLAYVYFQNGSSFNYRDVPISGGPGWIRSETYVINAKAEGPAPVAQMLGPMLRATRSCRSSESPGCHRCWAWAGRAWARAGGSHPAECSIGQLSIGSARRAELDQWLTRTIRPMFDRRV